MRGVIIIDYFCIASLLFQSLMFFLEGLTLREGLFFSKTSSVDGQALTRQGLLRQNTHTSSVGVL